MLVLSRRRNDKILFPNLGITVEILKVDGRTVRVGVDAPPEVAIQRHEIAARGDKAAPARSKKQSLTGEQAQRDQQLRQRINAAAKALNDLHSQFDESQRDQFETAVFSVFHELQGLDEQIGGKVRIARFEEPQKPRTRHSALLVEDNENESRLLASYLRCREFDVSVANEGSEAIDYLETHEKPDVVLLDMQMPGMDGPTTVRTIRNRRELEGLKVFAVSGGDPLDYGVELGPQGVDCWFPKPLDPESLVFRLALNNPESAGPAI